MIYETERDRWEMSKQAKSIRNYAKFEGIRLSYVGIVGIVIMN